MDVVTPRDLQTGATSLTLDALDFVHAVVTQIPDARKHLVRYYGAYSHRRCAIVREKNGAADALAGAGTPAAPLAPEPVTPAEPGSPDAKRRSACFRPDEGRRVLKKVFEVDPLVCAKCGGEMKVIAWITDRAVIDRILAHRAKAGLASPFEARGGAGARLSRTRRKRAECRDAQQGRARPPPSARNREPDGRSRPVRRSDGAAPRHFAGFTVVSLRLST